VGEVERKVYRGDGGELDSVIELLDAMDLNDYKKASFNDFDFKGKFSVFNFTGNIENSNSIDQVFKNLYLSLKAKKAEIELTEKSYILQATINYKYKEDELDVEEDIGFSVELYTNGDFSTNAVIMKDENTNFFTFKRFVEDWKVEFGNEKEDGNEDEKDA